MYMLAKEHTPKKVTNYIEFFDDMSSITKLSLRMP